MISVSVRRFIYAVSLAIAAGALTRLFYLLLDPTVAILFLAAIALSSWFWGSRPALVTMAVSTAILAMFFGSGFIAARSPYSFAFRLLVFIAVSILLIALINNLKRTRDSLALSEAKLAGIIRVSDDAVLTLDPELRIASLNPGAARIFGYDEAEVAGQPCAVLLPHFCDQPWEALSGRGEVEGRRKDGSTFLAEQHTARFTAVGEDVVAVRVRDITDLRRAELERQDLLERERTTREAAELAVTRHRVLEEQLTMLVNASGTLLGSVELSEVVPEVLTLAGRFLAPDACAVWRRTAAGRWEALASHGVSQPFLESVADAVGASEVLGVGPVAIGDVTVLPFDAFEQRRDRYAEEGIRSLLVVPMRIHSSMAGTIAFYYRTPHKFPDAEVRIASALGNLAASAIGSAELYQEQKRMRAAAEDDQRRSAFLAEATAVIASSLDYNATLTNVARLATPLFADWCAVDLLTEEGRLDRLAVAHVDPAKVSWAHHLHERYPPDPNEPRGLLNVLRTGNAELYPDITDDMLIAVARDDEHLQALRQAGMRSAIIVPMIARGRTLGAISFITSESGKRYTDDDLALAKHLGRRAALAIDNATLYASAERRREEAEAAAQALRRSNEDLQQFAYVASHDLQEPLRMVANYTQLLARRYKGKLDGSAEEYIGFAVEGVVRMRHMIDDLLAYSRAVQSNGKPHSQISAGDALQEALANLRLAIEETQALVTHDPMPMVRCDPPQLVRVFQNLIGNALKYRREERPCVHIGVRRENYEWVFSVRDNGVGIEPKFFNRVFGVFTRLHGREYEGTGMGLAICRRVVERMGGRIWVDSVPGEGSTFSFTLPA